MEKTYEKTSDTNLKEIHTPEVVQPVPLEQNFSLDYLKVHALELEAKKLSIQQSNARAILDVDAEIAENRARIDKCEELGIKSQTEDVEEVLPVEVK